MSRQWTAGWVTTKKEDTYHPVIFKDFCILDEITQATLFITGTGSFEAYINGERVGEEYLTPYYRGAGSKVQYFEYDVTDLIRYGENAESNSIDIFLGNSRCKDLACESSDNSRDRERFAVKAELVIKALREKIKDDAEYDAEQTEEVFENPDSSADGGNEGFEGRINTGNAAEALAMSNDKITEDDFIIEILDIDDLDGDGSLDKNKDDLGETITFDEEELTAIFDDIDIETDVKEPEITEEIEEPAAPVEEIAEPERVEEIEEPVAIAEEVAKPEPVEEIEEPEPVEEIEEPVAIAEEIAEPEPVEETESVEETGEAAAAEPEEEFGGFEEDELMALFDDDVIEPDAEPETVEEPVSEPTLEEAIEAIIMAEEDGIAEEEEEPEDVLAKALKAIEEAEEMPEEAESEEMPEEAESEEMPEEAEAEEMPEEEAAEATAAEEIQSVPAAGIVPIVIPAAEEEEAQPESGAETIPVTAVEIEKEEYTIVIATDETWSYYGSDIENSGDLNGEILNRLLWEDEENEEKQVVLLDEDIPVTERYALPVVVKETLKAKEVITTPDGEKVLDFGEIFVGYVECAVSLEKGEILRLEFANELKDGSFCSESPDGISKCFTYISDGSREVAAPHFTCFSGRYVKVNGWKDDMDADDFTACRIYSDMPRSGYIETSDKYLGRLYEDVLNDQKCSSVDIPENWPLRGEDRLWMGEANASAAALCYSMYAKDFYMRLLRDVREQQPEENGAAAAFIAWTLYRMYGSEDILSENYDLMKDRVDYIDREDAKRGERHNLYDFGDHTGDCLITDDASASSDGETDAYLISSAYYYESARIVSEAAKVLGREKDALEYAKRARRIKQAFIEEYYTLTGRPAVDTQTAYILAVRFGLYPDKNRLKEGFRLRLEKDGNRVNCGTSGASYICQALAEIGLEEKAWDVLLNEENKELLSYASAANFLYGYAAGIRPAEPGFSVISLEPLPDGRVREFKGRYRTEHGDIRSEWKIEDDGMLKLSIDIPEDMSARLVLPYYPACAADSGEADLDGGRHEYEYQPSKNLLRSSVE